MSNKLNRRQTLGLLGAGSLAATTGLISRPTLAQSAPIKVVGIHDGSGGLDIYGKPMIKTLRLAVGEINNSGGLLGRKVDLIAYDPQSSIQLYTQYATRAATQDKADVVFAGITSASREAIRPILRRFQTLYFYNTLYEGGVCDRNAFCTGSTPAQTVAKLIPEIIKRAGGNKIYIVAADYNYPQITAKWVQKYAAEQGGKVIGTEFFPLDVTDFGSAINRIQAATPDILVSVLIGGAHISFYRQWAAAGMVGKIPMASTVFGLGNEQVVTKPEEHNGILTSYAYFQEIESPANKAFTSNYFKTFGENAEPLTESATMTYHGLHMWAEGVRKAGTTDRMKVIEALESGISFDGPAGRTTIDPATHHNILDVYLATVKDHKFVVNAKYDQQMPIDTAAVCNLRENPNDNQQYVIQVKN